jgi:hypothetical protein
VAKMGFQTTNNLIPKDGKNIYHYGETVSLSCGTGYYLKGDMIIECEQSGHWNAPMPTCEGNRSIYFTKLIDFLDK